MGQGGGGNGKGIRILHSLGGSGTFYCDTSRSEKMCSKKNSGIDYFSFDVYFSVHL